MFSRSRLFSLALVLVVALAGTGEAFARAGGGGSFGSRGSRTFSAPSATSVAPGASPINRSFAPGTGGFAQTSRAGGFFSGGFGRGLLGGLVGAGLFGLLFGNGLFGGLGGGESFLGLLLQLGLLFLGVRLLIGFFRGRQPALGGGASAFSPLGGGLPFGRSSGGGAGPVRSMPLSLGAPDFDAFERRLGEVQTAYGSGDVAGLRRIATPPMAGALAEELAAHDRRGEVNRLSDVKLLAGDLSEAWREGDVDYATVAMRYALVDQTFERASGRLVAGSATPETVTEVWTFARPSGGAPQAWILSAIQQA